MRDLKPRICEWPDCGREFTPDVHSAHNQKYCRRASCIAARDKARKRKFREKMKKDPKWRLHQSKLSAESKERRMRLEADFAKAAVVKELRRNYETSTTKAILAGLAAKVGGTRKRETLLAFMAKLKMKGRKLLGPGNGL